MDEDKLRELLKTAINCPICTQVMLERFVVPGCQVLHMACRECCSKAQYCTQCKMNLAYSPLSPLPTPLMYPSTSITPAVSVAATAIPKLSGIPGSSGALETPGTLVVPYPESPAAPPKNTTLCCYSVNGCEYNCPNHLLNSHQLECRFRNYDCLGKSTDTFKCDWQGLQAGLIQHIMEAHANNWGNLSYKSDYFISINQSKEMQVFNSHGRTFVCVMKKNKAQHRFYWIIFVIGTKTQSKKYIYEFEIYKPDDNIRKIKFIEYCDSDATSLSQITSSERCVVVSENLLRTYLTSEGKIHYRFWIKFIGKSTKTDLHDQDDKKGKDNKEKELQEDKDENNGFQKGNSKKPPVQYEKKIEE